MISVCIASYNGEKYIKEELESILPQLKASDEIIISDDGSTDNTLKIIEDFNDKRITVLHHHKPEKVKFKFDYTTHNFENALKHAKGDFIFLADQDDIWLPEKVRVMMDALKCNDIVISDSKVVDKSLKEILPTRYTTDKFSNKILSNIINPNNPGCCIAFRKEILSSVLPFPNYGVAQDVWIMVFGGIYHKVFFVNRPLILFRRHDDNVSSSMTKSNNSLFTKLTYRILTIKALIGRAGLLQFLRNL